MAKRPPQEPQTLGRVGWSERVTGCMNHSFIGPLENNILSPIIIVCAYSRGQHVTLGDNDIIVHSIVADLRLSKSLDAMYYTPGYL